MALAPQGGEEEGEEGEAGAARELLGALVEARRGGARHGELEALVAARLGDAGGGGGARGSLAALELLATAAPVERTEAIHLACLLLGGVPTAPGPLRPASHPFREGRVGRALLVKGDVAVAQRPEAVDLDPRVVLRIAQTFGVCDQDLPGEDLDLLRPYLRSLLVERRTAVTVAPALAVQFRVGDFGPGAGGVEDLLDRIASEYGDEQSAFAFASFLSDDLRRKLVRTHVEAKKWKAAYKAARAFELDATGEFENVEFEYRKSSLVSTHPRPRREGPRTDSLRTDTLHCVQRKMARKHQWGVAAGYVESLGGATDTEALARYLLGLALEQRLVAEAEQVKKRFGLAFDTQAWLRLNGVDQAALRDTYLSLDERYKLRYVADAAAAEEMLATIRRVSPAVVGVDAEWKPKFEKKGQGAPDAPVALVQLAVPGSVFLVDALVPAALEALAAILSDAQTQKLGFGIKEDVRRLAQVVPDLEAGVPNVVDLGDLWGAVKPREPRPKGGLSGLCRAVLGKPLDKSQQLTDWEKRPLTASQIEYAALDATSSLDLYAALVGSEGERSKAARGVAFDFAPSRRPQQAALGPDDVQAFLRAQGLAEGLLVERVPRGPGGRGAVPEGAGQDIKVLKSIAVMPPCILLLNANEKACFAAVEAALERGEVRLASPEECVRVFGYRMGSMPPFGHRGWEKKPVEALLDEKLLSAGALWSGGGSPNHLVGPFSGRQLANAAGARAVRLTRTNGPPTISAGILPRSARLLRLAKR